MQDLFMIKDLAFSTKKHFNKGAVIDINNAKQMLQHSDLIKRLLIPPEQKLEGFTGLRSYE